VHLVGSIIRIYHDARSPERQALKFIQYYKALFMIPNFLQLPVTYSLSGPNKPQPNTPRTFAVCVKDNILHS